MWVERAFILEGTNLKITNPAFDGQGRGKESLKRDIKWGEINKGFQHKASKACEGEARVKHPE